MCPSSPALSTQTHRALCSPTLLHVGLASLDSKHEPWEGSAQNRCWCLFASPPCLQSCCCMSWLVTGRGWCRCFTPLMRSRQQELECVTCNMPVRMPTAAVHPAPDPAAAAAPLPGRHYQTFPVYPPPPPPPTVVLSVRHLLLICCCSPTSI